MLPTSEQPCRNQSPPRGEASARDARRRGTATMRMSKYLSRVRQGLLYPLAGASNRQKERAHWRIARDSGSKVWQSHACVYESRKWARMGEGMSS